MRPHSNSIPCTNIKFIFQNKCSFIDSQRTHSYNTKTKENLLTDKTKYSYIQRNFHNALIKVWNKVPMQIRSLPERSTLKELKNYLLNNPVYSLNEYFKDTYAIWAACRFNSTQNNSNQLSCENYEEDIRNKILAASLAFVSELGWSKEAISAGAQSVGYPGITHGMFARGGADLVQYFQTSSNSKLVEILKKFQSEHESKAIPPGEFAEKAIQARLKMIIPVINKWPQAIAIMSLPPNVPNALATLLTMVDDICYYAGDRSVDFNWYIRRIGIAAVYKATELYMIQDKSQEYEETWTFLNRRLGEAVQLHDLLNKSDLKSQTAKDTAQAAFITARNILGLNWNR